MNHKGFVTELGSKLISLSKCEECFWERWSNADDSPLVEIEGIRLSHF
jgi:hypothetical protein